MMICIYAYSAYLSLHWHNENGKTDQKFRIKQDVKAQALLFYSSFRDFNSTPWVLLIFLKDDWKKIHGLDIKRHGKSVKIHG